jgi:predicted alpha/beta hydrolase family esterase
MNYDALAIFIHGAGGGGWEWNIWQRVFARSGWRTRAADLMPAAAGIAATRLEDYIAQVNAWCEQAAAPYVMIGASLGGLLALRAQPKTFARGIVLINPLSARSLTSERLAQDIVPWGRERSLHGTRRALPDADDAACLYAFRRWRDESGAVLRAADQCIQVETSPMRALVLASEFDTDVPATASRALASALGADFRLLPAASHVGPLLGRNAAAVAAASVAWCTDVMRVAAAR